MLAASIDVSELAHAVQQLTVSQQEANKRQEEANKRQEEANKEANKRQEEANKRQEEANKEANKRQEEANRQLAILVAAQVARPPTTTPAQLAHVTLGALEKISGGIAPITEHPHAEAVLSPAEQEQLKDLTAEVDVVRFLTPFLTRVRAPSPAARDPCASVLVNSEQFAWLSHPQTVDRQELHQKPDLFGASPFFVDFRSGTVRQGQDDTYKFGLLAGQALQRAGCVTELYEAKLDITDRAFGELSGYHRCIPGDCYGMLFDRKEFWLYRSSDGFPVQLVKGAWTAPGSAAAIRQFFAGVTEPPLLGLLRHLVAELQLQPPSTTGRAYLGSGGYGHVFAVTSEAGEPQALKAILTSDFTHVKREYDWLVQASRLDAPVVPPVVGSLRTTGAGGGYLLTLIGKPFEVSSKQRCSTAFEALADLHLKGVIHGDARIPNLLLCGDRPRKACWIDLYGAVEYADDIARGDCEVLASSIIRVPKDKLPGVVLSTVRGYSPAAKQTVQALADAVWGYAGAMVAATASSSE